jgi:hypothetical protein
LTENCKFSLCKIHQLPTIEQTVLGGTAVGTRFSKLGETGQNVVEPTVAAKCKMLCRTSEWWIECFSFYSSHNLDWMEFTDRCLKRHTFSKICLIVKEPSILDGAFLDGAFPAVYPSDPFDGSDGWRLSCRTDGRTN